jgi:hypothetical protein
MSEKKKKPFNETKLGKFLKDKVKPVAGTLLQLGGDITGIDALEKVGSFLQDKAQEENEEALRYKALLIEFEEKKLEYELEFARLEMEEFKLEVQDKESARSREIDFMRANGGKRDWLMGTAVIVFLLMYVASFAFLAFGPVVPDDKQYMFNMLLGQVCTFAGMVAAYFLGTTKGSKQKDDTIKQAVTKR